MLLIGFLIFGLLPGLGICGCHFKEKTFYCRNVSQKNFLEELFSHRDYLNNHKATDIQIEDSDYTEIEEFPSIQTLIPNFKLKNLIITRSKIQKISNNAFDGNSLESIDLSHNYIDDINFICNSTGLSRVILSHNLISELDLNCLGKTNLQYLYIDNNQLSVVQPYHSPYTFNLQHLDISYNELVEFSEIKLNALFKVLNISYNNLKNVELKDKSELTIILNNTDLNSLTESGTFTSDVIHTSFIPQNTLSINNLYSMANTYVGNLDSRQPLKLSTNKVDFSNTFLTDISENYFRTDTNQLNLSYNNFSVLNISLFQNEFYLRNIDFSFSQIRNLSSNVFSETSKYFTSLNLTGNLLEDIPDICETAQYLENLDLSSNKLTKVYTTMLASCSRLRYLNISQSLIKSLEPGTFSNLPLITLNLSKNNLTTLLSYSFYHLMDLMNIDLSDNNIEDIESYAFSNLPSIDFIDLSRNGLKILYSQTFTGLGVQNINFEGNDIRYIQSKAFDGLYNLKIINLSNIGLATLEKDAFSSMSQIQTIDLSYNNLIVLDNYTFQNLPVSHINLTGNKLEKIHFRAFHNLQSLRQLNLSSLRISQLDQEAFSEMYSLEFIDLRDNYISSIGINTFKDITVKNIFLGSQSDFVHLENYLNVEKRVLQFNGTLKIEAVSCMYLKSLYIVNSQLNFLTNCFFGLYNLQELHFFNTNVSSYEPGFLNGLFSLISLNGTKIFENTSIVDDNLFKDLLSLENLILSNINLKKINVDTFNGLSKSLKYLHLDGNKLTTINFTVLNNFSLTYLDLSYNPFTSINLTSITEALPDLKILNISSCLIQSLTSSKFNLKTNSLNYLDLSHNLITALGSNIFASFGNLNELYLYSNRISSIDFLTFNLTNNLKKLRIDGNNLRNLKLGIFDGTQALTFLNISDNPEVFRADMTFILNLEQLVTLYMDNTGLSTFSYVNLVPYFPRLEIISINNNNFKCFDLLNVLHIVKRARIYYKPYNPIFNVPNYNGIKCN